MTWFKLGGMKNNGGRQKITLVEVVKKDMPIRIVT